MKKLLFLLTFLTLSVGFAQVSITGTGAGNTYSQDFNGLVNTGTTGSVVPAGWGFLETGTGANSTYGIGTGSGTGGDTYSFGTAASSERALGGLQSGSVIPSYGVAFTNNTGATVTDLVITYKGETWRIGAVNRADRLDFQYSLNATSLATASGTWLDDNTLDYSNPGQAATASGLQISTATITSTITGLGIAPGATFRLRWVDFNATGADDGMAIDDFSIYAVGGGATAPEINIKGNNDSIVDGASPAILTNHTDFGTIATGATLTRIFTIENTGSADLVLTSPFVQLTLASSQFSITQPTDTTIAANSATTFSVTFSSALVAFIEDGIEVLSNDTDESNYSFDIQATAETPQPEINITGNNFSIVDGATPASLLNHTAFGTIATGSLLARVYTIENSGTGDLVLTAPFVQLTLPSSDFSIIQPAVKTIPSGGSTTFTVVFTATTAGTFDNGIEVLNNDLNESNYSFDISAAAVNLNFVAGDISLMGVASDTDFVSFVNWKEIPVDAELRFTDNAFEAGALKTNESTMVWKNTTGSPIAPGTVIVIDNTTTTASADLGTVQSGALNGLSTSNDNVFIYEGAASSPNFIYGFSNVAWITTGVVNTNNSYLPAALNVPNGNIVPATTALDNYEFSGTRNTLNAISFYKNLVNNPANWTGNNTFFAFSSTDFTYIAITTTLRSAVCGTTLAFIYDSVGTPFLPVSGITGYRFKAKNLATGAEQTIDRGLFNWFKLTQLPVYDFATTYEISVELQRFGVWLGYFGEVCEVSTPAVPAITSCGLTVPAGGIIRCVATTGVTQYTFKVVNIALGTEQVFNRPSNGLVVNQIPGYSAATPYSVSLAVKTLNGTLSAFGEACTINPASPARFAKATTPNTTEFKAVGSPNPFESNFTLNISSTSDDEIQVVVYDMIGRQVDSKEINAQEATALEVGANYPSGVYIVIVSQGTDVKSLRMIKR